MIEVVVTIGITLALIGLATLPLHAARQQTTATAATLTALIDDARSLARNNDGTGSGAVLTVENTAAGATVSIFANRPLPGYDAPVAANHFAPAELPLPIALQNAAATNFSLAISPKGAIDVLTSPVKAGSPSITSAPGCGTATNPNTNLVIGTPPSIRTLKISCADGNVTTSDPLSTS